MSEPAREPMSEPATLVIEDVVAGYGAVQVLKGVSVTAPAGTITAVLGANGAGKTTLLRAIDGSVRPRRGRILLSGTDVPGRRPEDVARAGGARGPGGRGGGGGRTGAAR